MVQQRTTVWLALFSGVVCSTLISTNINIAIVSMIKDNDTQVPTTQLFQTNNVTHHTLSSNSSTDTSDYENVNWNKNEKNLVLGSYYSLSWMSQLLGGYFSYKFGGKIVFGLSMFLGSILSSSIPYFAFMDYKAVMLVRMIQGFLGTMAFPPALVTIVGKWSPPHQRGVFMATLLGVSVAISISYPFFGWIGETIGWQYELHVTSIIGLLWSVAWYFLVYESPEVHPNISLKERGYIVKSLQGCVTMNRPAVPWTKILTSIPFLANVSCTFGIMWTLFTLNMYVPTYFHEIHALGPKEGGLVYSIPQFINAILSIVAAITTDEIVRRNYHMKTFIRKFSVFLSSVVAGVMMWIAAYSGYSISIAATSIGICVILNAFLTTGVAVAMVDLSPNFCSVLQGINGSISYVAGFVAPIFVAYLTKENELFEDKLDKYERLFCATGTILALTGILFILFSSAELQEWNSEEKECTLPSMNQEELINLSYK